MEAMAAAASASKPQQQHQTWRKNGSCPAGTDSSRAANPEIAELARRSGAPAAATISPPPPRSSAAARAATTTNPPWPRLRAANSCFNLDCGGFHLTGNKHFALGSSFVHSDSQVGGDLYAVTFGIHRLGLRGHHHGVPRRQLRRGPLQRRC